MTRDCPIPGLETKKRNIDGKFIVPPARQNRASVLERLILNEGGIVSHYVDENFALVPHNAVKLHAGLSESRAREILVRHYDRNEVLRVSRWNETTTIYWARRRFSARCITRNGGAATFDTNCDIKELVPLVTAAEELFSTMKKLRDVEAGLFYEPANLYHIGGIASALE